MMPSLDIPDDDGLTQPTVPSTKSTSLLSKHYGEYSLLAKLQIEKTRLKLLRLCTTLKRPPASLRINGSSALDNHPQKLFHFSSLETKMLGLAISKKVNLIRNLSKKVCKSSLDLEPLPARDTKSLTSHFDKKLTFLKEQDREKWKSWPRKTKILKNLSDKKSVNFKRRDNKRRRKVEKQAKKALEDGSVIILVDTPEIPLGAISVLSKGLGFVPTPTIDVMQTRLDMRRTINNIVSSSRRNSYSSNRSTEPQSDCSNDSKQLTDEARFKLPSKLTF